MILSDWRSRWMPSIMKSKIIGKKLLYSVISAVFWLGVWEVAAYRLNLPFAIPTVEGTLAALVHLASGADWWLTIGASLGRILQGLLTGTMLGVLLAALSVSSELARALIAPAQMVIRCTPVASFIMILWILVGRDQVPGAIAVLMVSPVLWQNLCKGYESLDQQLDEVLMVYRASFFKRLRLLVLPGLKNCFLSGLATAAGLAWKAGVAAEIITYTSRSIGRRIADARNLFNGEEMMAWTLGVVLLSLLIERLIAIVGKAAEK